MNNKLESKLKELKTEDLIWAIYIGIIFMSWFANSLERKYYVDNDQVAKDNYRKIMIGIFIVLIIAYFYFLYSSYQDLKELKDTDSEKKKRLIILSFLGSLLIFISGLIFLYIAFVDEDLTVELAFN